MPFYTPGVKLWTGPLDLANDGHASRAGDLLADVAQGTYAFIGYAVYAKLPTDSPCRACKPLKSLSAACDCAECVQHVQPARVQLRGVASAQDFLSSRKGYHSAPCISRWTCPPSAKRSPARATTLRVRQVRRCRLRISHREKSGANRSDDQVPRASFAESTAASRLQPPSFHDDLDRPGHGGQHRRSQFFRKIVDMLGFDRDDQHLVWHSQSPA